MRRFSSYGPIDTEEHYHAPRKKLIEKAMSQLLGDNPQKSGHYITAWAPRQCGKTWVMQEAVELIKQTGKYDAAIISMERTKKMKDESKVLQIFIEKLQNAFEKPFPVIKEINEIPTLFTKKYFQKPVILVLDEFDALEDSLINRFAAIFRDMFISRSNERHKTSQNKTYLLHALTLIGVRSVLGIENETGSPFNVQRSLHIPNLSPDEVKGMFLWYQKESNHKIAPGVIDEIYDETRGQPGLTCRLGELLTEGFDGYSIDKKNPLKLKTSGLFTPLPPWRCPTTTSSTSSVKPKKMPIKRFYLKCSIPEEKQNLPLMIPSLMIYI